MNMLWCIVDIERERVIGPFTSFVLASAVAALDERLKTLDPWSCIIKMEEPNIY